LEKIVINKEFHDSYSLHDITSKIKSRRTIWDGEYGTQEREKRRLNIFGGEPDGRKPFRRHSMDLRDRMGGVWTRFIWPSFSRTDVLHGVNFK
jgi:hypothetical protein